uniref:(northern house mosquito) hypothetical protein n=1 Tax=Culex pipiens TaxID=7175 RepID=A0A8D8GDE5_CULPI
MLRPVASGTVTTTTTSIRRAPRSLIRVRRRRPASLPSPTTNLTLRPRHLRRDRRRHRPRKVRNTILPSKSTPRRNVTWSTRCSMLKRIMNFASPSAHCQSAILAARLLRRKPNMSTYTADRSKIRPPRC